MYNYFDSQNKLFTVKSGGLIHLETSKAKYENSPKNIWKPEIISLTLQACPTGGLHELFELDKNLLLELNKEDYFNKVNELGNIMETLQNLSEHFTEKMKLIE